MTKPGSVPVFSLCLCLLTILAAVPGAEAQQGRGGATRAAPKGEGRNSEKEPAPAPEPPPAPYDRDLMRLSEIVGALAFLRELCADPDAAQWPVRMKALLEAEGVTPGRRDRLAGAYNRGYRGYALTYRVCTSSAREAATRFVTEGERLSHALASRFGG
ncbi:MAG: TIGR02301 family protein [Methylobacterium sp.]|uniref:TIGR02301 family protein n=1 Tax=unclassified Methylobacterium TaxID=2615210 RepID=UPI001FEEE678|nr:MULTISPECIES: TIGR02301 family protein [unclassified Methylobacterium]MDO9428817.1 TIGR02301 family protein [Methylobacterium sp.]